MSMLSLHQKTLDLVQQIVSSPSSALPDALKSAASDGRWDLLTQRLGSDQLRAQARKAELSLPLLDKAVSKSGSAASDWSWTSKVSLKAELAIDLLASEDIDELGVRPDADQTLIAYGAELEFDGSLGAKGIAHAWVSVGVAAGGSRSSRVRWFVQARTGDRLIEALDAAQRHFVSPDNLAAMLKMTNRTDWFGMELSLSGQAQLAIDVAAKASAPGWTVSIDGDQSNVGLSVGMEASLSAKRESEWLLRTAVVPIGDAAGPLGLRVALHDLRQSAQETAIKFNAGADFSAVTAQAERLLRAAWPELDSDLLDGLTRPGTALGSALSAKIEQGLDGPLKDLALLMTGAKGSDALKSQLVGKLTGGLAQELDGALGDIAAAKADASQVLNSWIQRLLGPSAPSLTMSDELKALVQEAIDDATAGLESQIGVLKNKIVGKAQSTVDQVLKPLGELGAQFDRTLERLDGNSASTAIRTAVSRYADLRSKLLSKLTDANRQKVMLTLSGEWKRETGEEALVEVIFVPPKTGQAMTPEAELLYHAICSGRLLALPQLIAAAQAVNAISSAKGWLLSSIKTMSNQRTTLNFLGHQFENSTSWLREVGVKVDLVTGDLIAAKGSLSVETAIVSPWMNRKTTLGVSLGVTGSRGAGFALSAALNGAFVAMAGDFATRDKVQDLLDTYAKSVGGPRTDVERMLPVPGGMAGKAFWKDLTLSIPVSLDPGQWKKFADRPGDEIDAVSFEVALRLFARRYQSDSLFSDNPVSDLADYAAAYFDAREQKNLGVLAYLKSFPKDRVTRYSAAATARSLAINANDSGGPLDRGSKIFFALQRLSAIVQAPRRLQALAVNAEARVQQLPTSFNPQDLRNALDDVLKNMQQVLSPVALVSETLLGLGFGAEDEPVSWPFTSFITTMAKLSGVSTPPGFVPVAQVGQGLAIKLLPPV